MAFEEIKRPDWVTPGTQWTPGQTQEQYQQSQIPTVNIASLKSTSPVNIPTQSPDNTNYNGIIASGSTLIPPPIPEGTKDTSLQDYLKTLGENQPQSQVEAYNAAYNELGIQEKQQEVSDLTARLNSINAEARTANLTLEQQASGKDITTQFLGRQQQEISRQTAIKALPVQAQLAAAQGNLQLATDKLNTLFKLKSDDATNAYNLRIKQIDAVYNYMTKEQQNKADAIKEKLKQDNADRVNNLNQAQTWATTAITQGQGQLASQIMALDPKDPNYQTKLGQLAGQIKPKATTPEAPTIKSINGVDMQWNPITRKWEKISVGIGGNIETLAQSQRNINNISQLLKGGVGLETAVGTSGLTRSTGFWGSLAKILGGLTGGAGVGAIAGVPFGGAGAIPGAIIGGILGTGTAVASIGKQTYSQLSGKQQEFISGTEQLQSQLSLDSLIQAKAKGATFGALSDTEMRILASSATKLGTWAIRDKNGNIVGYNTSEKSFKAELDKINNFAKLDYLLKGGSPEDIGVKQLEDGTYWTQNSDGTYTKLQ